ncbi:Retrovirus polyprotein [Penicillium desertorum]|uniref:Retrovirus polyprotein n=1 Tax=Penicillium desertorum TaxID=1303715 RepID=A0A9X0BL98_9EURO|nr:Retrovirus polyprotein [Penicillium desertorum]
MLPLSRWVVLVKRPIFIACHKNMTVKQMARLIVDYVLRIIRNPGIKIKLSTAYHQTKPLVRVRSRINNWSEYFSVVNLVASMIPWDIIEQSPFFIESGYEPAMSSD